ncbi:hypothetical protein ACFXKG_18435 [Streptomyces sp. NPDC059255]|uniref:hypothetical protein n=1 Tax=Streptomyces sp. NPDC059255 TaxID=3346793 RepID=UPI003684E1AF
MTQQTDAPQGTHHFVITIQKPLLGGGGFAIADMHGFITLPPAWSRHDAFEAIREEHARRNPDTEGGSVLFFSLELNQL